MKIWYFDKKGFHKEQDELKTRIEITEEERLRMLEEIKNSNELLIIDINPESKKLYLRNLNLDESFIKNNLRRKRKAECFSVINRGPLWYDTLTESQKQELKIWYKQWLDVTINLSIPNKPEWLE
jgi:hypothetical protein